LQEIPAEGEALNGEKPNAMNPNFTGE